jgi:NAD+ kinase
MRVRVYSRFEDEILPAIERHGFDVVLDDPEVVISYGGDGTLLGAERTWPGVPKIAIRRSKSWSKCKRHQDDVVLTRLKDGDISSTQLLKLEGTSKGQTFVGLNDIIVHHARVSSAVRYRVRINSDPYSGEIIGDGLVVATPFGSRAYYRSITHSIFHVGMGLAFNNSTELVNHLVLSEESQVEIEITRGPARLVADNNPEHAELECGETAMVQRHPHSAVILGIDVLHCEQCHRIRS